MRGDRVQGRLQGRSTRGAGGDGDAQELLGAGRMVGGVQHHRPLGITGVGVVGRVDSFLFMLEAEYRRKGSKGFFLRAQHVARGF